ncbi:type II toxin-antitoxin system death-on-curing family toxin [Variovorax sp. PCZ-1]|nr:type II toxin-antitoxin system death-on-curing family toxin [Variovorax sp. PCZ-1]MBS7808522.1 type II toxin-antitoxin system death-on-curing family toxin [Variovorax sp. PCZ-1]
MLALHDAQLAEHGGISGVRDMSLLDSAMAEPLNMAASGEPSVAKLAASYAYGIARNHPFLEGNIRTACVAAELFLVLNSFRFTADNVQYALIMRDVASKQISEDAFAAWIEANIAPKDEH